MKSEETLDSKIKISQKSKCEDDENKTKKTGKLSASRLNSHLIDAELLSKKKKDLMIEEALSLQAKAFQKEMDELEVINANLEKDIMNLEIKEKENASNFMRAEKKILLEEYEQNLQIKLNELQQMNENRVIMEQDFQRRKFQAKFQNLEKYLALEEIPKDEEENLIISIENEFARKYNFFLQEKENIWLKQKAEIDEKIQKYYENKKTEYCEELNRLVAREVKMWEEEKSEKIKSLEKFFKNQEENSNSNDFDLEIQSLEKIKDELELYQKEKNSILEELKEKESEFKELCMIKKEVQTKIETKYKKIALKSQPQKQRIKEKNMMSESMKSDFIQDESKIYFSSNNTNSDSSCILEPIPTGKFREKTTNSKESFRNNINFQNYQEDEIVEFSSNYDEEVDFDLSSEGSGRNI